MTKDEFIAELRLFLSWRAGESRELLDAMSDDDLADFFACFAYGARDIPAAEMDRIIAQSASLSEAFLRMDVFGIQRIPDPRQQREALAALYGPIRERTQLVDANQPPLPPPYDPGGTGLA